MAPFLQDGQALFQLSLDRLQGLIHFFLCRDIMAGRINRHVLALGHDLAGQHVDLRQPVDFVSEHFNADDGIVEGRRKYFYRIAVNAEGSPLEIHIVAGILDIDELMKNFFLRLFLSQTQRHDEIAVILRVA